MIGSGSNIVSLPSVVKSTETLSNPLLLEAYVSLAIGTYILLIDYGKLGNIESRPISYIHTVL